MNPRRPTDSVSANKTKLLCMHALSTCLSKEFNTNQITYQYSPSRGTGDKNNIVKSKRRHKSSMDVSNLMESKHPSKRGQSSPCPAMPTKRIKAQPGGNTTHLPSEMWAVVMNHLDFSSVLSLTAMARATRDAAPLVTELHIVKSCQMIAGVGRRFKDVTSVFIYSLIQDIRGEDDDYENEEEDEENLRVDFDTSMRAVPFISSFSNIKKAYFGGRGVDGSLYKVVPYDHLELHPNVTSDATKDTFARLIDMISFGYKCGTLSTGLDIKGLRCPFIWSNRNCKYCKRACWSFPVQSVADFEYNGYSEALMMKGKFHSLDVCIGRDELVKIVRARPGGKDALSHGSHLFRALELCDLRLIGSKGTKTLWFVRCTSASITYLRNVLQFSSATLSTLNSSEITAAITKSFPVHEKDLYLLEDSLYDLFKEFNLRVDDNVFGSEHRRLEIAAEFLPQIAQVGIIFRCFSLLKGLAELPQCCTKNVFDSGVISVLLKGLDYGPSNTSSHCLGVLTKLCIHGELVEALVELGFLVSLNKYLLYKKNCRAYHFCIDTTRVFCDSLRSIASTSPLLRNKVLESDVLCGLLQLIRKGSEAKNYHLVVNMMSTILCNEDMTMIDFGQVNLTVKKFLIPKLKKSDDAIKKLWLNIQSKLQIIGTWEEIIPANFLDGGSTAEPDPELTKNCTSLTINEMRVFYTHNGVLPKVKIDITARFTSAVLYQMKFHMGYYGFKIFHLEGRAVVLEPFHSGTKVGAIIAAIGSHVLPRLPFDDIKGMLKNEAKTNRCATITFLEDAEFEALLVKRGIISPLTLQNQQGDVIEANSAQRVSNIKRVTIW